MTKQEAVEMLELGRRTNPLWGLVIGSEHVVNKTIHAIANPRGVNVDLVLVILASLAGYACQDAGRDIGRQLGITDNQSLVIMFDPGDGSEYYYGNSINHFLFEGPRSILAYMRTEATNLGMPQEDLPDIDELARHVVNTLGTPQFGVVRYPPGKGIGFPAPIDLVRSLWPQSVDDVRLLCNNPAEAPELFAAAIRRAIALGKDVITPKDAIRIVMETAGPMARVNLPELVPPWFHTPRPAT
jgi:hypothetical protein